MISTRFRCRRAWGAGFWQRGLPAANLERLCAIPWVLDVKHAISGNKVGPTSSATNPFIDSIRLVPNKPKLVLLRAWLSLSIYCAATILIRCWTVSSSTNTKVACQNYLSHGDLPPIMYSPYRPTQNREHPCKNAP